MIDKNSIKARTLKIIVPAVIASIATFSVFVTNLTNHEIQLKLNEQLDNLAGKVEKKFISHSKIAELLAHSSEVSGVRLTKSDYVSILKKYIETNPDTLGAGVWFEPYLYRNSLKYWGPYSYRDKDQIVYTDDYNNPTYDYFQWDWYKSAVNKHELVWSSPYFDPVAKITMITASYPMYRDDKFIGVTTADLALTGMQSIVKNAKAGHNGWAFIIDKNGTYVANNDIKKAMKIKISEESNSSLAKLSTTILQNKEGKVYFYDKNGRNTLNYKQIGDTGLTLGIVMPESDVYGSIIIKVLAGSLIFLGMLVFIIDKLITKIVTSRLAVIAAQLKKVADGNLGVEDIRITAKDEIGSLAVDLNATVRNLRNIVNQVAKSATEIVESSSQMEEAVDQTAKAAQQLSGGVEQLATGSKVQSDDVNSSLRNVNLMDGVIAKISTNASQSVNISEQTERTANQGKSQALVAVNKIKQIKVSSVEAAEKIQKLGDLSSEIGTIADIIRSIASQTNLLALNAAIEAARAGEHGKGFAVVAEEVKQLANQSSEATEKITDTIKEIQQNIFNAVSIMDKSTSEVDEGVGIVENVGSSLDEIYSSAKDTSSNIDLIFKEIQSLTEISHNVVQMMENIASIVEENAASTEEMSSITEEQSATLEEISSSTSNLVDVADELKSKVSMFKL